MREKLRLAILDAYGIDIDKYDFEYKNAVNSYTIRLGEYTIRVCILDEIDIETRIERMKWALDLKQLKNTICEPVPTKNGDLVVGVKIGAWNVVLTMYRTAKGEFMNPDDIHPMFLIAVGDMLGTIHHLSMMRNSSEEKYKIPSPNVMFEKRRQAVRNFINPDLNAKIDNIIGQSAVKQKNLDNFGVCYGEFDLHNIFVDTNNIHLFDFDGSVYGHYLYDVASFVVSILSAGYLPGRPSKSVTFDNFIPWFRIGYSINKRCDAHTFEDLPFFMELRGVSILINLIEKYQKEEIPALKAQIEFVSAILSGDDIFEGIDKVRNILFSDPQVGKKLMGYN